MTSGSSSWHTLAASQAGLLTRAQLSGTGIDHWAVAHRVRTGRWREVAPTVVSTTTGELSHEQSLWRAVLHAGDRARLAGLTAAEEAGLTTWHRDEITVIAPYDLGTIPALDGVHYIRSRRPLAPLTTLYGSPPRLRIEPAILLFAAADRSDRTAQAVLAAAVQQRLTDPEMLLATLTKLQPLRRAALLRRALREIAGGAHSLAEMDIIRMCRMFRLSLPRRQVRRRGGDGRLRFTDCEWPLPGGRILVLEVDGSFHMEAEQWEDDLARQRSLSATHLLIVRCTARELRDEPERVADDLVRLGVPRAA